MLSISKTNCHADRSILALLSAYQEYQVTFNLRMSKLVQRAQLLSMPTCICTIGSQRFKYIGTQVIKSPTGLENLVVLTGWLYSNSMTGLG